MRQIELTKGYAAIVDDEDYSRISMHKWYAVVRRRADGTEQVYAARKAMRSDGRRTTQYMHSMILKTPQGMCADHVDGSGLNNSRTNLRVCTQAENARNIRTRGGSSSHKGVYWSKAKGRWRAQIRVGGKFHYIGCFTDEIAAARAYDDAAVKLHGEFARLNLQ